MATLEVYRYDFYDPVLKRERRSIDYATPEAIAALHAKMLVDTVQTVDEILLDDDGTIRASHVFMEPPPVVRGRPRPAPRRAA